MGREHDNFIKTFFFNSVQALSLAMVACAKGSDSAAERPAAKTKVGIIEVIFTTKPATNGALSWDTFDDPDLYAKIYSETGHLVTTSSTLWNFMPSLSNAFLVTFNPPTIKTDLTKTVFKVETWDYDSDATNPDDKIGEVFERFIGIPDFKII